VNEAPAVYQTEADLEKEFIRDLINQGYENPSLKTYQENVGERKNTTANAKQYDIFR
jgi:hypothetical protein